MLIYNLKSKWIQPHSTSSAGKTTMPLCMTFGKAQARKALHSEKDEVAYDLGTIEEEKNGNLKTQEGSRVGQGKIYYNHILIYVGFADSIGYGWLFIVMDGTH